MYGLYQIVYFTLIDILNTILSPFFIVLFFFIFYQYINEAKIPPIFGNKVFSWYKPLLKAVDSSIYGLFGGFLTTILFIYLEVSVVPLDFIYIIGLSIILSMINTRFVCIAYSGSIVVLSSILFGFPLRVTEDIMLIVAILHVVESILIMVNGHRGKTSTLFEKENDLVGGFSINRYWPVPFVIFIGDGLIKPITLMAILAYGDYTFSSVRLKTTISSLILLLYSILIMVLIKFQQSIIIPPIFALLGHEFIVHINILFEKKSIPIFSSIENGVRVLEVNKKGIARKLGINPGDIIISINDLHIKDFKDLSQIESLKMDAIRVKFLSRKKGIMTRTYKGDKKTLGISIVPRVIYY